jgi:endonuclease/exonuclease/phosphatase family metal-dependent hydrolase
MGLLYAGRFRQDPVRLERDLLLRVMTYNIHRAIGVDRRFRPERIVEILRHYDPDVVLLQARGS